MNPGRDAYDQAAGPDLRPGEDMYGQIDGRNSVSGEDSCIETIGPDCGLGEDSCKHTGGPDSGSVRKGRILGLDFGSKTVGVAVSDALLMTAQGLEIIRRKSENKLRQTLARIESLVQEYQVERIVLGLPRNMNYTAGGRVMKTLEFREQLIRRTGLKVLLWDERLTTVAADRAMMESGIRREDRKDYVDEIAAMLILQGYLDRLSSGLPVRQPDIEDLIKQSSEV